MTEEQWRRISDFPEYLVSDRYRVKSALTKKVLKPSKNQNGTEFVHLRREGKTHSRSVYKMKKDTFGL